MINSLKNQFEGFLKTPPLWHNSEIFDLKQFYFPELSIPANTEILENIPNLSINFVLGKRIEFYFAFAVTLSAKSKILAENVQISQNKITLVEIDFILDNLETK